MSQLSESTKALALAHLHTGKKPKEVEQICNISYAQALKLSKDLAAAKTEEAKRKLFNLDDASLEILLEAVTKNLEPLVGELINGEELNKQVSDISKNVKAIQMLEADLAETGKVLSQKIRARALVTENTDSILVLAEALAKLQSSFFAKGSTIQIANFPGGEGAAGSFESLLSD